MNVEITLPDSELGSVLSDISSKRRAHLEDQECFLEVLGRGPG